jgi:hypothetical protein
VRPKAGTSTNPILVGLDSERESSVTQEGRKRKHAGNTTASKIKKRKGGEEVIDID